MLKSTFPTNQGQLVAKEFHKKSRIIPLWMKAKDNELYSKPFSLYQLERSWMSNIPQFKDLVCQLSSFNKQLIEQQTHQKTTKNIVKKYHFYRNLYQQLNNLNSMSSCLEHANNQLGEIKRWYEKEKIKITHKNSLKEDKLLPGIKLIYYQNAGQQQEDCRTITAIRDKRQSQVYHIMPRTAFSHFSPPKDRTLEYKRESAKMLNLSQTVSVFNQSSLNRADQTSEFMQKSKSQSNMASTAFTQVNYNASGFSSSQSILKTQKLRTSSDVFASKRKSWSHIISKKESISHTKIRKNRQSFLLIDDMIKKDRIQKIIDEPDSKQLNLLKKSINHKSYEANEIKSSRISFIIKPQKTHLINRNEFLEVNSQMTKLKRNQSRFRTEQNRKLQFRQYFSNHIISKNVQVQKQKKFVSLAAKIGPKIMLLPKKQVEVKVFPSQSIYDKLNASKLQISQCSNQLNPQEKRRKQFENNLKKTSSHQNISNYVKYLNHHINQHNPKQNYSEHSKSHLSNLLDNSLKNNTNKIESLTNFRSSSLQQRFNLGPKLAIVKTLQKYTDQRHNIEAANEAVKAKLKISQKINQGNMKPYISSKTIYQGLCLPSKEKIGFVPLQPKLFSNPFFKVKSSKKGKKKKK